MSNADFKTNGKVRLLTGCQLLFDGLFRFCLQLLLGWFQDEIVPATKSRAVVDAAPFRAIIYSAIFVIVDAAPFPVIPPFPHFRFLFPISSFRLLERPAVVAVTPYSKRTVNTALNTLTRVTPYYQGSFPVETLRKRKVLSWLCHW